MADSLFTMPFGKHKGEDIEDLDTSYLVWLAERPFFEKEFPAGLKAVETELAFRKKFGNE